MFGSSHAQRYRQNFTSERIFFECNAIGHERTGLVPWNAARRRNLAVGTNLVCIGWRPSLAIWTALCARDDDFVAGSALARTRRCVFTEARFELVRIHSEAFFGCTRVVDVDRALSESSAHIVGGLVEAGDAGILSRIVGFHGALSVFTLDLGRRWFRADRDFYPVHVPETFESFPAVFQVGELFGAVVLQNGCFVAERVDGRQWWQELGALWAGRARFVGVEPGDELGLDGFTGIGIFACIKDTTVHRGYVRGVVIMGSGIAAVEPVRVLARSEKNHEHGRKESLHGLLGRSTSLRTNFPIEGGEIAVTKAPPVPGTCASVHSTILDVYGFGCLETDLSFSDARFGIAIR